MDDGLYRITDSGDPLNDTWSNYQRRHRFVVVGPVVEQNGENCWRVRMVCRRCHQIRKVGRECSLIVYGKEWGCPRVPLLYRLRLWLQGRQVPTWSVNEPPPWWAGS